MKNQRGFTLLELLVVLAIIGFAMAAVSLSLRDSGQTQLEREGQRLVAMLEAARAQSRTSGIALVWQPSAQGFVIGPLSAPVIGPAQTAANVPSPTVPNETASRNALDPRRETWLSPNINAIAAVGASNTPSTVVILGPEPILAPARITLSLLAPEASKRNNTAAAALTIGTDGLRPFERLP